MNFRFLDYKKQILVLCILLLVLGYGFTRVKRTADDYHVFHLAGERLLQGERIHFAEDHAFSYPPSAAVVCLPFSILNFYFGKSLFYLLNVFLVALAFILLKKSAEASLPNDGLNTRRDRVLIWFLATLLSARFLLSVFEHMQTDLLVLVGVLLGFYCSLRGKEMEAGAAIAFGAAIKVTPILLLFYFLWKRRFKTTVWMLVFLLLFLLLPEFFAVVNGKETLYIDDWYTTVLTKVSPSEGGTPWAGGGDIWQSGAMYNQSLGATLYRYTVAQPVLIHDNEPVSVNLFNLSSKTASTLTYIAYLILILPLAYLSRRKWDATSQPRKWAEFSMVLLLMLLMSPQSSKAHFVTLLIPYFFLLYYLLTNRTKPKQALTVGLALSFVLNTLTTDGLIGSYLSSWAHALGLITVGTLILLILLVLIHLRPERADVSS